MDKVLCLTSRCIKDDKHILIWDFDTSIDVRYRGVCHKESIGITRFMIEKALYEVQSQYQLGDIFLIKSKNGYNAICLDKFNAEETLNIHLDTKYTDKQHNYIGYERNKWCLRIGKDKLFVEILKGNNHREKSKVHRQILEQLFTIFIMDGIYDDNNLIEMESYKSKEHEWGYPDGS